GDLPRGFLATDSNLIFIPDTALFGAHRRRQVADRVHAFFDAALTSLHQIKEGNYIVHKLHGVGLYLGLERMDVGVGEQDYAKLEYRGGDILYLPLSYLSLLSRYVPAKKNAKIKLDRLGGQTWEARQGKVRDSLLAMAEELLKIQAKRKLAERPPFAPGGDLYHPLGARFAHDETPDQATAIDTVQDDLSGDRPMDRLLCGDVGFGKTEVAMRAAARIVEAGFQVAVLCPTTVLAYQHVQTFRARFDGLAVQIEMLSRFNTAKQSSDVLTRVKAGQVDILIGTTSILGRGVRFPNLGLMVIDEEHRFGVKQKARLKKMRIAVDVLSMSATPIPRTLQMGLSGMRDMSLIATPPKDRLAVRTSVSTLKEIRIRDAVMHELDRKGQVFFVHNRVESINQIAERLREWVPEARIEVAHGQMSAKQLETVLVRFTKHEFDMLVCTSIMETGIDLPNVNTMVVNRADQFGLAQLYQLRGRVGRGAVRASCLLLLPEDHTKDARRRVQVMVENSQLGAGFSVAAADLEIRGAGNLIGEAQSGNIDAVGYEVWLELLEQAVHRARGEMEAGQIDPEVEVPVPAFIPEQMVKDTQERLVWYRKISAARTVRQVELALEDLEMERGELPREVTNLGSQAMSRIYCKELGIVRCSFLKVRVVLEFHPGSKVPKQHIIDFAAATPRRYSVNDTEGEPLTFEARVTDAERDRPYRYLRWLFVQLRRDSK
ncbi:MAG: transcription-repair coupling factor (superfamily II helicase), partial [Kiritimatiellia bacterium]